MTPARAAKSGARLRRRVRTSKPGAPSRATDGIVVARGSLLDIEHLQPEEITNLLRYRRLRNAKAIGGAAEVSRLGYGQEIPQVTHLNRIVHRAHAG